MPTSHPQGEPNRGPGFKGHFSTPAAPAALYAQFRPQYPEPLFAYLAKMAPARQRAWDCATGSGQAAAGLARYFAEVVATDASLRQVASAAPVPETHFALALAEASALANRSLDLVTLAQSFHRLDLDGFYAEVRWVLRPGGTLAVWSYGPLSVNPEIDAQIFDLYETRLGRFWPPERAAVENGYRTCVFPFAEVPPPAFAMAARWTLDRLMKYLRTWSAVQNYRRTLGEDLVEMSVEEIRRIWGDAASPRTLRWPLKLRLGVAQADAALPEPGSR